MDSAVAKSFVATRDLAKMRHLEVELHGLQELVHLEEMKVSKVSGTANVVDAFAKHHVMKKLEALCRLHGIVRR